ncbi:MAG: flagellar basal body-associated FliL family protein [Deltaproteobacteria bacterium]|nr:flagellar basal body-associated FliL family protein [Deltaproteobacteria bacterium]
MSDATPTPPPSAEEGHGAPAHESETSEPKESAKQKATAAAGAARDAAKAALGNLGNTVGKVFGGAKGTIIAFITLPLLIFKGDLTSRILTFGFLASVLLVFLTSSQLYHRFVPQHVKTPTTEAGQGVTRFLEEEKKIAIMAANVLFLERFSGSLDSGPGQPSVFELELYVEADSPESAAILRAHLPQTREMVSGVIQGRKYEALITDEGKNALKRDILDAVNRTLRRWAAKGQVKKVYFTKFVMG